MENLIAAKVDRCLHSMHPTKQYEGLDYKRLDQHLPLQELRLLLEKVDVLRHVTAEVELPNYEMERSHVLHIGLSSLFGWTHFNREMSDKERVAVLRMHGSVRFWQVHLSRVGPFWMSYWNEFVLRSRRVVATLQPPPSSYEWSTVIRDVRKVLSTFSLHEVPDTVLNAQVPWLRTMQGDVLKQRGRAAISVSEALFYDLC